MIIRGNRTVRQALTESFKGIARPQVPGLATEASFFQQGAMPSTLDEYNKIFGTPEEFLENYRIFDQKYNGAIQDRLDLTRANRIEAKQVSQRRMINLDMLDYGTRDELSGFLKRDVFKLNEFIRGQGLFGFEIPSSNAYRATLRADIDTTGGIIHPAQLLMSNMTINYNPDKSGLESLSIGSRFQDHASLLDDWEKMSRVSATEPQRLIKQIDPFAGMTEGQKILTVDIESTGIHQGAQLRSFAAAIMQKETAGLSAPETVFSRHFASNQFNGISVPNLNGGTRRLNEFIAHFELASSSDALKMMGANPQGMGDNFLEGVGDLFHRMLEADKVAGHNIGYDLEMVFKTAQAQDNYAKFKHAGTGKTISELVDEFNEKSSRGNYIVDTLQSTRAYLYAEAQKLAGTGPDRQDKFIQALLSEDVMANVKLGGDVKYAGVTEFVTNTNFFELIERDPSSEAQRIIREVYRGSHIANTDVHLQSYIGKFLHEKAETGELKLKIMAERNGEITKQGSRLRERMLKSSAFTPTTNIASVEHMGQTTFDYLTGTQAGRRSMEVRASVTEAMRDIGFESINQNIPTAADIVGVDRYTDLQRVHGAGTAAFDEAIDEIRGTIRYSSKDSGFIFSTSQGSYKLKQAEAEAYIVQTLEQAKRDVNDTGIIGMQVSERFSRSVLADDRILNTGINFSTQSASENIRLMKDVSAMDTTGMSLLDKYSSVLGSAYEDLGIEYGSTGKLNSFAEAFKSGGFSSTLSRGVKDFTSNDAARLAEKFAAIGDPYAKILDPMSRAVSTGLAEATMPAMQNAARSRVAELSVMGQTEVLPTIGRTVEETMKGLKYLDYGKTFAEMGVWYGQSQNVMQVFSHSTSDRIAGSKIMIQPEIVQNVMQRAGLDSPMFLGFSQVSSTGRLNYVWDIARQSESNAARLFTENLFDLLASDTAEDQISDILKVDPSFLPEDIQKTITFARSITEPAERQTIIDSLADSIEQRGVVVGFEEGDEARGARRVLDQFGMTIENELRQGDRRFILEQSNITGVSSSSKYGNRRLAFSPLMDQKAIDIAGASGEFDTQIAQPLRSGQGPGVRAQVQMAEEIEAAGIGGDLAKLFERKRTGIKAGSLVDFYNNYKGKMGWAALGVAAAGVGYYISKRHRENALYEETLAQQPAEVNSQVRPMNSDIQSSMSMRPRYSDPLATAGVVGTLDRTKIGHTRMGNNKNSHLFGA